MTPSGGSNSTEQTTVQNAMGAADYKRSFTGHVNPQVVLQDQLNSRPAPDKERNDLQLIAGIGCKL
ncbi:MAG: hypothetical protein ABIH24_01935 [Verrucomicrobiota bacterium]